MIYHWCNSPYTGRLLIQVHIQTVLVELSTKFADSCCSLK